MRKASRKTSLSPWKVCAKKRQSSFINTARASAAPCRDTSTATTLLSASWDNNEVCGAHSTALHLGIRPLRPPREAPHLRLEQHVRRPGRLPELTCGLQPTLLAPVIGEEHGAVGSELGAVQNFHRVPGEEDPGVDEDVLGERAQQQRVELGHVADGAAGEAAAIWAEQSSVSSSAGSEQWTVRSCRTARKMNGKRRISPVKRTPRGGGSRTAEPRTFKQTHDRTSRSLVAGRRRAALSFRGAWTRLRPAHRRSRSRAPSSAGVCAKSRRR